MSYLNRMLQKTNFKQVDNLLTGYVTVENDPYSACLIEVLLEKQYEPYLAFMQKPHTIIDVGGNRGYSALYFANLIHVDEVYVYEPCPSTYQKLLKNLELNPHLSNIKPFNYGLSNKTQTVTMYTHPTDDGINTTNKAFLDSYWSEQRKQQVTEQTLKLKKASPVIKKIKGELVLKIDCEGAEYEILEDLKHTGLLSRFELIIGEYHLGLDKIKEILTNYEIVYHCPHKKESVGVFMMRRKV